MGGWRRGHGGGGLWGGEGDVMGAGGGGGDVEGAALLFPSLPSAPN